MALSSTVLSTMCSSRSASSATIASCMNCALVYASLSRSSVNPLWPRTWLICVRSLLRASSSLAVSKVAKSILLPNSFSKDSFSLLGDLLNLKSSVVLIFRDPD